MSVSDREKRAWLFLLGALAPLAVGVMVYFDYGLRESDAVMREVMLRRVEVRPERDGSPSCYLRAKCMSERAVFRPSPLRGRHHGFLLLKP